MSRDYAARRRTRRAFWITLGLFVVIVGSLWHRNERAVRLFVFEQVRFIQYRTGNDALLKDLAARRVRAGDDAGAFVSKHPPDRIIRHGRFVTLSYGLGPGGIMGFEGTTVIAKDGKLFAAAQWSCTSTDVFFSDDDPVLMAEYSNTYDAERQRLSEVRHAQYLAVLGFGATFYPWELPQPEPPE